MKVIHTAAVVIASGETLSDATHFASGFGRQAAFGSDVGSD